MALRKRDSGEGWEMPAFMGKLSELDEAALEEATKKIASSLVGVDGSVAGVALMLFLAFIWKKNAVTREQALATFESIVLSRLGERSN